MLGPLIPIPKGQKGTNLKTWSTMSPEELNREVKKRNNCNVGLRLENYASIDPDSPEAEAVCESWEREGKLPPTWAWMTARGVVRRLYLKPEGLEAAMTIEAIKLQLRTGKGLYDVIPPSYVKDPKKGIDGHYVWLPGQDPESIEIAPLPSETLEYFQKNSGTTRPATPAREKQSDPGAGHLDVEAYLNHYGREIIKIKPENGGRLFGLRHCVFDPDHSPNDASIIQAANGKLIYQCFHNSCKAAGRKWKEAREKISGGEKLTPFMVGGGTPPASINSSFLYEQVSPRVEKALRDGGLDEQIITYVLNSIKKPDQNTPLAQRVREWALVTSGYFLVTDCYADLHLVTGSDKNTARQALLRMEKEGRLEKCGDKRGCYRLVDTTAEELRWWEADTANIVPLELPFDLHKQVTIFHKTIIIVAGVTDSGKTAYLLNTALQNKNKLRVNYFSMEMPEQELKKRLERFKELELIDNMDEWRNVIFMERPNNFHQVIKPDEVNIIDYLDITKEFWQVADQISEIYNKLKKGVAIIALQKKQGQEYGLGGHFSAFRSRLYIAMDKNELKVVKAKNWSDLAVGNPANKVYVYKLVKGAKFIQLP